jgi:hypothetical protein
MLVVSILNSDPFSTVASAVSSLIMPVEFVSIVRTDPFFRLPFVFRGRLVQAAGVTDGGGGFGSMRRDTAGLASSRKLSKLGDWGECCAVTSCAGSLKAVAAMPFLSTAAMLRSILSQGVIADFGDDADA